MKKIYKSILVLMVLVLQNQIIPQAVVQTGGITVELSEYGRIRLSDPLSSPSRMIDRSSILVGILPDAVFNYREDAEAIDTASVVPVPEYGDFEIAGSIDNSYSGNAPNVKVLFNIYGWTNENGALVKIGIINNEVESIAPYIGFEILPQIDSSYGFEFVENIVPENILGIYREASGVHVGYKYLSHPMVSLKSFEWFDGYDGDDNNLFDYLSYGLIDSLYESGGDGSVAIPASDTLAIPAGDTLKFYMAVSVGSDRDVMKAGVKFAEAQYNMITTSVFDRNDQIAEKFSLSQNYPNPFNPTTTIEFAISERRIVNISIHNLLGEKVAELINGEMDAGSYSARFDGSELASGIYFYRMTAGSFISTSKMILMK